MSDEVNLKSVDAMFATVLHGLKQNEHRLTEIRDMLLAQEKRIEALEDHNLEMRSKLVGGVLVLSTLIGAFGWAVQQGLQNFFSRT